MSSLDLTHELQKHKTDVRLQVWSKLKQVALPDSRFDYDFSEFIADFNGSSNATKLLMSHPAFKKIENNNDKKNLIFIAPDNCLEELRYLLLCSGKSFLMTSYGIKRGFFLLNPKKIPAELFKYVSTLDGMENFGEKVSLQRLMSENFKVSMMITGTGAINDKGIRFGKGHGYFDIEWALLYSINVISIETVCVAVVHDCQVLEDIDLKPEIFDTVCDLIITNSRSIEVGHVNKPTVGILWDVLDKNMFENIEPIRELKHLQDNGLIMK